MWQKAFFKTRNDPRITKTGKFLRRFRIDEAPQIINVFRGELSLIGPRPHEPKEMLAYPPEYHRIFLVKGGITGLSQIENAAYLPFQRELELDLQYVQACSLGLDIKILLKTVAGFFFRPNGI